MHVLALIAEASKIEQNKVRLYLLTESKGCTFDVKLANRSCRARQTDGLLILGLRSAQLSMQGICCLPVNSHISLFVGWDCIFADA